MARLACSLALLGRGRALSCLLLLCYLLLLLLGGLVFRVVEQPAEEALRAEVEELWRSFLQEHPCVEERRLRELLRTALSAGRRDVAVLEAHADRTRFDFTSSLYFVIVTLTTMGSDSFNLQSDEAKLFCVFYCTLGIPLTLFLLTLLSNRLLPLVTYGPVHHLHYFWGVAPSHAAMVHATLLAVLVAALLFLLPALLLCAVEPQFSYLDALFFCLVTLSTVGEGGASLGRTWGPMARKTLQLLTTGYLLLGLVVVLTFRDTVLQVPQVCALLRLLSGLQHTELERLRLHELTGEESCEEEPQYAQSVCTISSSPLQLMKPSQASTESRQESLRGPELHHRTQNCSST